MEDGKNVHVLNWSISCRYFEIGLEEYILLYIITLSEKRAITFTFNNTGYNGKTVSLIEKYKNNFIKNKDGNLIFLTNVQSISDIRLNTNLKEYCNK